VDRGWLARGVAARALRLLLALAMVALLGGTFAGTASAAAQAEGDTLTLAPDLGLAGTTVTASGTGHGSCLDPDGYVGTVALLWDEQPEPIATATVREGEGFSITFQAPAEPGPHQVGSTCMVNGKTSGARLAAAAFRVLAPTLVLDPVEGPAGSQLVASGREYPPACTDVFVLQFDRTPLLPQTLERARDPDEGWVRFRATVKVPATARPGSHEVSVRCSAGGLAPALATARFQVTVPPTTTSTTTTTTTVPPSTTSTTTTLPPSTTSTTTSTTTTVLPTTTTVLPTTTTGPPKQPSRLPSIASVTPGSTPPGRVVEVRGDAGSCNRVGTLTFHGPTDVPIAVAGDQHGDFVARFTVPAGTFPKAYRLELRVDCKGRPQRAEGTLKVTNRAPVAADDSATTLQDTAVAVAVTGNDADPDGDGDYPALVFEQGQPAHGTTGARPDGTFVYTPDPGFVGQDRFRYRNCDVLAPRDAAGRWVLACGTATVTVTVNPASPTTTTGVPPTSTTRPDCQPRPGDVRSFRVDPAKGSSGARLHVNGEADRRLVGCPLGLLLGGSRLGPNLVVRPDGTISQRLSMPDGVKAGATTLGLVARDGQVLAQVSFEVLPTAAPEGTPPPWWQRDPLRRLLAVAAALTVGFLARAATRRWRRGRDDRRRQREATPQYLHAEPHAAPVRVALDQATKGAPNLTVRLRPHHDAGTQTLTEVTG
jgi:hypothetical protein